MKKLLIIALIFLVSCNQPTNNINKDEKFTGEYEIVNIEDCENVYSHLGDEGSGALTHKGNCKNYMHYENSSY